MIQKLTKSHLIIDGVNLHDLHKVITLFISAITCMRSLFCEETDRKDYLIIAA